MLVRIAYLTEGTPATQVEVEVHPEAPQVRAGWGDRRPRPALLGGIDAPLAVYTDRDALGRSVEVGPDGELRRVVQTTCQQAMCGVADYGQIRGCPHDEYPCAPPPWAESVRAAARIIREAALRAEREHPDVGAAVESYATLCRKMDAQGEAAELVEQHGIALSIARQVAGRRRRITRSEAAEMVRHLLQAGACGQSHSPEWWASATSGLTVVSLGGQIRYDQPGSAHPLHRAQVHLVGDDAPPDVRTWARARADRTFVVGPEARE